MLQFDKKIIGITAILLAVILVGFGVYNIGRTNNAPAAVAGDQQVNQTGPRHPLNGQLIGADFKPFYPVAIMIENAADVLPQTGLQNASIVYEALTEGNITRLLAIFDSNASVSAVGPVRSARNYYMDWADEYPGVYMHVGGSPQAMAKIADYDFIDVDQIGKNEQYFWRDDKKSAPSNVFTSSANWTKAGTQYGATNIDAANLSSLKSWNFVQPDAAALKNIPKNISLNFSSNLYKVSWNWDKNKKVYFRSQAGEKYTYLDGKQVSTSNVIVQMVESGMLDAERRDIMTQTGGQTVVYNQFGRQVGTWKVENGRTLFFDAADREIKLVPGTTWVEIVDDPLKLNEE